MNSFLSTGRALLSVLRAGLPPGEREESLLVHETQRTLVYTTQLAPDRQLLVEIAIREADSEVTCWDVLVGPKSDAVRAIRGQYAGYLIAHDNHGLFGMGGQAVTA